MSVLDVDKEITEETLKSIGFFRAAYDVVPSYFKLIPLDYNKYRNCAFVSVRYIPYIEELTININTFITPYERSVKTYNHINDINEINILVHQYIQQIKK